MGRDGGGPICRHTPGAIISAAVAGLLLATLTPLALEVALSVSDELNRHAQHADSLRAASVQRAQHGKLGGLPHTRFSGPQSA